MRSDATTARAFFLRVLAGGDATGYDAYMAVKKYLATDLVKAVDAQISWSGPVEMPGSPHPVESPHKRGLRMRRVAKW